MISCFVFLYKINISANENISNLYLEINLLDEENKFLQEQAKLINKNEISPDQDLKYRLNEIKIQDKQFRIGSIEKETKVLTISIFVFSILFLIFLRFHLRRWYSLEKFQFQQKYGQPDSAIKKDEKNEIKKNP